MGMAKARKDATMAEDKAAPAEDMADLDLEGIEEYIEAEELDNLRAERDEFRDKFMRALADAENSRKRADRDRREAEQYGSTRLARDLLPVYDNLKRALDAANDEVRAGASALIEGVELTLRELTNVMTKHGVTPISPAIGDMFNPQEHQAMFEAPLPGTKAGEIIQVMTEGFMLHDRLLRPAQVGVSSNTAK
jgi:molecular chaperone GrpE